MGNKQKKPKSVLILAFFVDDIDLLSNQNLDFFSAIFTIKE